MTKYVVQNHKFEKTEPPESMAVHYLKACEKGDLRIVEGILKNDASILKDINIKDLEEKFTNAKLQSILNAKNDHVQNGFHLACSNGHAEVVKEILEFSGTSKEVTNAKDFLEQNGLHAATSKGYEQIIQTT